MSDLLSVESGRAFHDDRVRRKHGISKMFRRKGKHGVDVAKDCCDVCKSDLNGKLLLKCSNCSFRRHLYCFTPPLQQHPLLVKNKATIGKKWKQRGSSKVRWVCDECIHNRTDEAVEGNNDVSVSTPDKCEEISQLGGVERIDIGNEPHAEALEVDPSEPSIAVNYSHVEHTESTVPQATSLFQKTVDAWKSLVQSQQGNIDNLIQPKKKWNVNYIMSEEDKEKAERLRIRKELEKEDIDALFCDANYYSFDFSNRSRGRRELSIVADDESGNGPQASMIESSTVAVWSRDKETLAMTQEDIDFCTEAVNTEQSDDNGLADKLQLFIDTELESAWEVARLSPLDCDDMFGISGGSKSNAKIEMRVCNCVSTEHALEVICRSLMKWHQRRQIEKKSLLEVRTIAKAKRCERVDQLLSIWCNCSIFITVLCRLHRRSQRRKAEMIEASTVQNGTYQESGNSDMYEEEKDETQRHQATKAIQKQFRIWRQDCRENLSIAASTRLQRWWKCMQSIQRWRLLYVQLKEENKKRMRSACVIQRCYKRYISRISTEHQGSDAAPIVTSSRNKTLDLDETIASLKSKLPHADVGESETQVLSTENEVEVVLHVSENFTEAKKNDILEMNSTDKIKVSGSHTDFYHAVTPRSIRNDRKDAVDQEHSLALPLSEESSQVACSVDEEVELLDNNADENIPFALNNFELVDDMVEVSQSTDIIMTTTKELVLAVNNKDVKQARDIKPITTEVRAMLKDLIVEDIESTSDQYELYRASYSLFPALNALDSSSSEQDILHEIGVQFDEKKDFMNAAWFYEHSLRAGLDDSIRNTARIAAASAHYGVWLSSADKSHLQRSKELYIDAIDSIRRERGQEAIDIEFLEQLSIVRMQNGEHMASLKLLASMIEWKGFTSSDRIMKWVFLSAIQLMYTGHWKQSLKYLLYVEDTSCFSYSNYHITALSAIALDNLEDGKSKVGTKEAWGAAIRTWTLTRSKEKLSKLLESKITAGCNSKVDILLEICAQAIELHHYHLVIIASSFAFSICPSDHPSENDILETIAVALKQLGEIEQYADALRRARNLSETEVHQLARQTKDRAGSFKRSLDDMSPLDKIKELVNKRQ